MSGDPHSGDEGKPVSGSGNAVDEFKAIVGGDVCSGCGACAVASQGRIPLGFQPDGRYLPDITGATADDLEKAAAACPFSSAGPDEDTIAASHYGHLPYHPGVGRYAGCFIGHVEASTYRARGSSGGLVSWVASRLLEAGEVDGILHVRPVPRSGGDADAPLFRYAISTSVDELAAGSKSHYYPVEMSEVLGELLRHPEQRFAVIGIPCFLKGLRRLQAMDPRLQEQVRFTIGIFCGHLKTAAFAEMLAWQAGIPSRSLAAMDFRHKLPDRPASQYAMAATATDGTQVVRPMSELLGKDWGQGWFRLNACSFCDDITAEVADISIGDAWLPGWIDDSAGTNIVVARSDRMQRLMADGISAGSLAFQAAPPEDVVRSQAGGFRYRREALALRLAEAQDAGRWVPAKRVQPARRIRGRRRRLLAIREEMAATSRSVGGACRTSGDFTPVLAAMEPLIAQERQALRPGLASRLKSWLKRRIPGRA